MNRPPSSYFVRVSDISDKSLGEASACPRLAVPEKLPAGFKIVGSVQPINRIVALAHHHGARGSERIGFDSTARMSRRQLPK